LIDSGRKPFCRVFLESFVDGKISFTHPVCKLRKSFALSQNSAR
jgi:hypothetical protein